MINFLPIQKAIQNFSNPIAKNNSELIKTFLPEKKIIRNKGATQNDPF